METAQFMLLFLDTLLAYSSQLHFKENGRSCDITVGFVSMTFWPFVVRCQLGRHCVPHCYKCHYLYRGRRWWVSKYSYMELCMYVHICMPYTPFSIPHTPCPITYILYMYSVRYTPRTFVQCACMSTCKFTYSIHLLPLTCQLLYMLLLSSLWYRHKLHTPWIGSSPSAAIGRPPPLWSSQRPPWSWEEDKPPISPCWTLPSASPHHSWRTLFLFWLLEEAREGVTDS